MLVIAFWSGIGALLLIFGFADILSWGIDISNSRTFPRYITTYELATLATAIALFSGGIVSANLAWSLFRKRKSGYFISIILTVGLILIGPLGIMISENPNYILAGFMALMPAIILILTLVSQVGFVDG